MINSDEFLSELRRRGIEFFAGVPDSLLANLLGAMQSLPADKHLICANEGAAIAAAAGYHFATGSVPLVYMQNSGLGNAVNPILSLTHPKVYSVPMLIVVGWRGAPGVHDEPQHQASGQCTLDVLSAMGLQYEVLAADSNVGETLNRLFDVEFNQPRVLVVKKNAFAPGAEVKPLPPASTITRARAIESLLLQLKGDEAIVCTTGFTSRELYMQRQELRLSDDADFLNVGAMGHASQIALGIALAQPARTVVCLDGDGSTIMHMGSMAVVGDRQPRNFKHILLNNCCHESVGGQPTAGETIDFPQVAGACGYTYAESCVSEDGLSSAFAELLSASGPAFLEVMIQTGTPGTLPRPDDNFQKRKAAFMTFLTRPIH